MQHRFDAVGKVDDHGEEIQWVFTNISNKLVDPLECPSRGAWDLLLMARKNRKWFYEKDLPSVCDRGRKAKSKTGRAGRHRRAIDEGKAGGGGHEADAQRSQGSRERWCVLNAEPPGLRIGGVIGPQSQAHLDQTYLVPPSGPLTKR